LCGGAVFYLARPTPRLLVIGGAVAGVGELIRIWAAGHLNKGQEVTQSGPYRFTRHPLYAGSAVVALGAAIASGHAGAAAVVAAYMATTLVAAIRHEESNMRGAFSESYAAYLESRSALVKRPFDFDRAMRINKEYKTLAGLAVVAALLTIKAAFR
jgi:protein-S-isoprenylcysteine O-methyltransferase Ste14